MAHKISGTNSSFHVGWSTAGKDYFRFVLVLAGLSFWRGTGRWAIVLCGL